MGGTGGVCGGRGGVWDIGGGGVVDGPRLSALAAATSELTSACSPPAPMRGVCESSKRGCFMLQMMGCAQSRL